MKRTVIDARGDRFSLETFGHFEYEREMTPDQEASHLKTKEESESQARKEQDDAARASAREAFLDELMSESGR